MTQRIPGIDPADTEPRINRVLAAQADKWGAPLINHRVYARIPAIFHAVRGMWSGLDAAGLLPPTLVALINRRVAALNHCPF